MKKTHFKRRLISISEISSENVNISDKPEIVFNYNPITKEWEQKKPLYNTNIIQKIRQFEDLNELRFNSFMEIYSDIFGHLSQSSKINNQELINFFHKLSYFSFKSLDQLRFFWKKWKNE